MPRLLCICGPNGAGKSTLTRILGMRENLLVIDPDRLAEDGLNPVAAGKAAGRLARMCLQNGISFARESTLTSKFDFWLMAEAKQRGYRVELIYLKLPSPALALERISARKARGGHDVPREDVIRRFHRSLANLPRAQELVDKLTILDNSSLTYHN